MDSYDLDDEDAPGDVDRRRGLAGRLDRSDGRLGPAAGRLGPGRHWWAALVVPLLVVTTAGLIGVDQRRRDREFSALIDQVAQGQSAIRYSDARIQAMVQQTSPYLISAQAPAQVRSGLRAMVQQEAAERVAPLEARRDAVAGLEVSRWHDDQRRARDAYRAYLDQQITFLRAVAANLRALYQPRPERARRLAAARDALLRASSDGRSADRIRHLLV